MPCDRQLLTIDGAAEYLGTTVRHLRGLTARRAIPYFKVGQLVRFDIADLDEWLEANRVEAVAS